MTKYRQKDEQGRMIEDATREAEEESKHMYPDGSMHGLILSKVREAYVDGYMARWVEE